MSSNTYENIEIIFFTASKALKKLEMRAVENSGGMFAVSPTRDFDCWWSSFVLLVHVCRFTPYILKYKVKG